MLDDIYKVRCGRAWHAVRVAMIYCPQDMQEPVLQTTMLSHGVSYERYEALQALGGETIACAAFCEVISQLSIDDLLELWSFWQKRCHDGNLHPLWSMILEMMLRVKARNGIMFRGRPLEFTPPKGTNGC